ncbi:hypothetical protein [Haliangium sp.]|uniref:fibronectin type III domain-containing protein n=1 Tax=Haliangium sp. TaxID=2663208 RepID=UPI003D11EAE1
MKASFRSAGLALAAPIALCALILSIRPAAAVVTAIWSVDAYEQWDEGEAEHALITSLGEVRPGWGTERTELELEGVWAAVRSRDGSVVLGTDDDASVYRVQGGKTRKLATIPDVVAVVSLAESRDGTLYAGTMPGGQVWRIPAKGGEAKALVSLDQAETVWALAFDKSEKTLYAGTGPEGGLFAIDVATGKAKLAFDSEDKRILSVVRGSDGAIWLGTSEQALVFRHDPERGVTRAMADFSGNEITTMAAWAGGVIVAANDFDEPSTSGAKTKAAIEKAKKLKDAGEKPEMPKAGTQPGADKPAPAGAEPARKGARKGKGALYRVYGDGSLEQLHALTATYFSSVVVTESGRIFAGAGDKGRIYLVDVDDSVSTAFDVEERIVAALLYEPGAGVERGLWFATSDAAALYRTNGRPKTASYTTKVFDTDAPSRFGKLVWHGVGDIKIETRTGNTAEPGKGWSQFQAPAKIGPAGGGARSGRIASPVGRYLQVRVTFTGKDDEVLRKLRAYYLPQNRPTKLTEVQVKGGRVNPGATLASGAADPRSPMLDLSWETDNPDDDKTEYRLEVRREGEARWRPLRREPVTGTSLRWNTETFPDGYYRLRVIASDKRSNSPDRAREHIRASALFLVDNDKPEVSGVKVSYPRASARASDAMSAIAEMAFSVDDGPWQIGATADGLFDDTAEFLRIDLPEDLDKGTHTLAIRVADEAGNVGSTSVSFRVE